MEPDIFQINEKTCYLIYNEFLVLNLPLHKVNECIKRLKRGKRYKSDSLLRQIINNYTTPRNNNCHTINLKKDKFTLFYNHKSHGFLLRKGFFIDEAIDVNDYAEKHSLSLMKWLDSYFNKYGVSSFERIVPKLRYWKYWLVLAVPGGGIFVGIIKRLEVTQKFSYLVLCLIYLILIAPTTKIVFYYQRQKITETVYKSRKAHR